MEYVGLIYIAIFGIGFAIGFYGGQGYDDYQKAKKHLEDL